MSAELGGVVRLELGVEADKAAGGRVVPAGPDEGEPYRVPSTDSGFATGQIDPVQLCQPEIVDGTRYGSVARNTAPGA